MSTSAADTERCALNAASSIGGGVAPGEIVTILVGGSVTGLLFNGVAAPIFAATEERLTAMVPLELAGGLAHPRQRSIRIVPGSVA